MKRWMPLLAALAVCSPALLLAARAQQTEESAKPADIYSHWKFRDLGPAQAGGRVTSVVGVPGNPKIYYVGSAGGGVWKTTDGGQTWKPVFEHEATSSIGVVALAPSNPNLVWVGTGEANIRNDLTDGAGVYFSPDGGHTWKLMGLRDAGQISTIQIDPHDPNTVFVGVLGHAWAPNAERGVFKTTDGGKTWKKVLFVNDTTGVSDLVMAPGNSRVLFAGMYQVRRYPWKLESGGPGSGVYRSTDGGDTWQKLTKGLPKGPVGRIAVAVAPTNPDRVYALMQSKQGLLWESNDMGDTWTFVSKNQLIDARPFYFTRLFVASNDENRIYFCSFFLVESDDGGKTARAIDHNVHVDHHAFWVDPADPDRMIQGNDGGAYLSLDRGKDWKFLDGMPLEQLYMVALGSDAPPTICGGLQDNDAWCGSGIPKSWYNVQGGDGEYVVPAPSDPNIIYAESQNGFIARLDKTTRRAHFIRPSLKDVGQYLTADLKYRFNWTTPIAVSPTDANEVYMGANVLFRSTDGGKTWTAISPDLTRNDKSKQQVSGGPINFDMSGAETYDTILSITLAPSNSNVIWVGTDDGQIQVTRDGGKSWTNVTANVPGAPQWARVYQIGVSPFDPGTAYAGFDAHMLDDTHDYVYRTRDYGKTWQKITDGLPESPVHVVREDPNQRGLLFLGNDRGLYDSTDDGDHWQKFPVEFPTVPVWDITFQKSTHDLALATHGRGFFILDNLRPFEQMSSQVSGSDFHLFSTGAGTRYDEPALQFGSPDRHYKAPLPPRGAIIDYFLKKELKTTPEEKAEHQTPVKITIADASGHTIRTAYGPAEAGLNRFVWDMRYDGPTPIRGPHPPAGEEEFFGMANAGPFAAPGTYKITVTAGGYSETGEVTVNGDPNVSVPASVFRAQLDFGLEATAMRSAMDQMINRANDLEAQMTTFEQALQSSTEPAARAKYQPVLDAGKDLRKKLEKIKDSVYTSPGAEPHYPALLQSKLMLLSFVTMLNFAEPPSAQAREIMGELRKQLDRTLADFNAQLKSDVAAYNRAAAKAGAPTLFAGEPLSVKKTPAAGK